MSVKQTYLQHKAAAAAALKKDLHHLSLMREKKAIEEAGGMKYHYVVPSRTESKFTVGGSKVLHKSTGGDRFTNQLRYAKAMS